MVNERSKINFTTEFFREKINVVLNNSVFLCVLCGLFSLYPLAAQDVNYRVDVRYIQRLTWVGDEYAMRYQVIIEKYENRRYSNFFQGFTEDEFIEVTLPPGNYRYQVIPHDYLDVPIPVTEWTEFEVLKAEQTILGSESLSIGPYKFDIFAGVYWTPLFPVYNAYLFSGGNMSLAAAEARVGFVFAGLGFINPGLELGASWQMVDDAMLNQSEHLISITINLLGQIRFKNNSDSSRMALNFRFGAGVSLLSNTQNDAIPKLDIFHLNIGVSFFALVMRHFYIEAGIDCPQFISIDHYGYFRPFLGIGARF